MNVTECVRVCVHACVCLCVRHMYNICKRKAFCAVMQQPQLLNLRIWPQDTVLSVPSSEKHLLFRRFVASTPGSYGACIFSETVVLGFLNRRIV